MKNEADGHFTFNTIFAVVFGGLTTATLLLMYWGVDYSGTFIEAPALRWLFYLCEVGVLAYAVAIHRKHREMAGYTYTEDGLIDARNAKIHKWSDVVWFEKVKDNI